MCFAVWKSCMDYLERGKQTGKGTYIPPFDKKQNFPWGWKKLQQTVGRCVNEYEYSVTS